MNNIIDIIFSNKGKWIIISIWILIASILIITSPPLDETTNDAEFLPNSADSTKVFLLTEENFTSAGTPLLIVIRNNEGLSTEDYDSAMEIDNWLNSKDAPMAIESIISVFSVPGSEAELVSEDKTTMNIVVNLLGDPTDKLFQDAVKEIRAITADKRSDNLEIESGGPAGLIVDLLSVFQQIDGLLLLVTVILVLILLLIIYRSPVVALIPVIIVGLVMQLSLSIVAFIADNSSFLVINGQSRGIMTVVLFGSGTDYCLFMSSRYKEELIKFKDKYLAIKETVKGVGSAVISAGGTIFIASIILLLADLRSYQSLGPVIAIAVLIMTIAALTLVPAALLILGRAAFWPFIPRFNENYSPEIVQNTIYGKVGRVVLKKPIITLTITIIFLGTMIFGLIGSSRSFDPIDSLPSKTESVKSYELLRESFPPGTLSPTVILLELGEENKITDIEFLNSIDIIASNLVANDKIDDIIYFGRPFGFNSNVSFSQVLQSSQNINIGEGTPQDFSIVNKSERFLSNDKNLVKLELIFKSNPNSHESINFIPDLRVAVENNIKNLNLNNVVSYVGGQTAQSYDSKKAADRDLVIVLPLILLAIGIILAILLKSFIAPIYLIVTIIFTYFSTLGLAAFIFIFVFDHQGLTPGLAFFLFVFLNALGVDYNIYLMSRLREESRKNNLSQATINTLASTGGVITSAGLILAGTFSALMTLPLQDLFQLGFAVALGVLMDTFITRTLIVPSLVTLLGKWNWWPFSIKTNIE